MRREDFNWIDEQGKAHPYSKHDSEYFAKEFGVMLDYAVNYMHYDPEMFMSAFLNTKIPICIEYGSSIYIAGKDGTELCMKVEKDAMNVDLSDRPLPQNTDFNSNATKDFWVGYMIALYQWHSNLTFKEILEKISVKHFYDYYWRYHQEDENHFMNELDRVCKIGGV